MLIRGVEGVIKQRCSVTSFADSYGDDCSSTQAVSEACFQQCRKEMRIHLTIESTSLATFVFVVVVRVFD
jgi:hypothetical protein